MPDEYISFSEACKLTGKSEDELKALTREKGLRQFRDAGATKFRREEFLKAMGIKEEAKLEPPAQEEEDDFLVFADEEESKSDTVSDTLDLAEDLEEEKTATDSAELTSSETVDVEAETEKLAAEEFDFGEEDIFADESTTDIPAGEAESDTAGALEELEMLEEDESGTSGSSEEETSQAVAAAEAEGTAVKAEEEEQVAAPVALGEVAEAEEAEGATVARAPKPRVRRPMRPQAPAEGASLYGILCVVAAFLALFVGLMVVDQLIGKQWDSVGGKYVGGINSVQGLLESVRNFFWDKGGHYPQ
ncbi:MAG: hypothetical protein V2A58_10240 [Planctomycetota bacterium]